MHQEFTLEKTYEVTTTIKIVKNNDRYYAKVHRNFDDLWQEDDEYECWIDQPSNLMTEENPTEKEYDAIIETFCSYIKANGVKYARCCDKCSNVMNDGYVVNGGCEYYCTPKCLHEVYTPKEWKEMYAKGFSDQNYWTEWENEEDYNYVLFDNQLITL